MSPTYRLRIPEPHAHLVAVELTLPAAPALEVAMPAWTPGSYLVRDYARHVRDLHATQGGRALAAGKLDKQTWRVAGAQVPGDPVVIRYRVYAHELTVRTAHVDDEHAFLHPAAVLLHAPARAGEPHVVELELPADTGVATGLREEPDSAPRLRRFVARDADELYDCPIEIGGFERLDFAAAGVPHHLAVCGRARFDRAQLVIDVKAFVDQAAALFGGLPYESYTFLLHFAPGGQGGLEHHNSSAILASPHAFYPRKAYEDLLELLCHEHFHVWNVKRIRPAALGPFDYRRENYTRSLWVMEGITSYYGRLLLRRANLLPAKKYLARLGEELAKLHQVPGRFVQSLEEASFDAWIKFYRPDESTPNATVSYYLKGGLVALALDLEIRRRTASQRSLDDVMRLLFARFGAAPRGFEDERVQALFEEATGLELGTFFDDFVRGRAEVDLAPYLSAFGLRLEGRWEDEVEPPHGAPASAAPATTAPGGAPPAPAAPAPAPPRPPAWLGVTTRTANDRLVVAAVPTGGPGERHGLYPGDEIVALDAFRVDEKSLRERLAGRAPGEAVRVALFRRDELTEIEVTLGARPFDRYELTPDPAADETARALYTAWLGEPFPG
jgi:predicted metalloprotease with PDZ domain